MIFMGFNGVRPVSPEALGACSDVMLATAARIFCFTPRLASSEPRWYKCTPRPRSLASFARIPHRSLFCCACPCFSFVFYFLPCFFSVCFLVCCVFPWDSVFLTLLVWGTLQAREAWRPCKTVSLCLNRSRCSRRGSP